MADIFREIDEELRQEKAALLWKKYGTYLIAAAVLVVVAVAGVSWWQQHQASRQIALGGRFAAGEALVREGKLQEAAAQFEALAADATPGYATLARFYEAGLKARAGDVGAAVALYDRIAGDSSLDRPYRDAATVFAVQHALDLPAPDFAQYTARLEPLLTPRAAFRHSAMELLALIARQQGDNAKARDYLTRIADDLQAPQNMRARATQLLALVAE